MLLHSVYLLFSYFSLCSILKTLFDGFDVEREGKIHINQLSSLLTKLRKPKGKINEILPVKMLLIVFFRGNT
jgi:Ca2+-binding EF-hand superfamily protein